MMKTLFIIMSSALFMIHGSMGFAQGSIINPEGMTVETRFAPPDGYKRIDYQDAYVEYIRKLPMLAHGSPVLTFSGAPKASQHQHVGVLDIDVGNRDLQQCSDAAQRLRAEFLYQTEQFDKINYHFSNGMEFPYMKWKEGYRIKIVKKQNSQGKEKSVPTLVKSAKPDSSYAVFRRYMDMLFTYAGVNSVMDESRAITIKELRPGDALADVGHLIIILDVVENAAGHKKFLLAQSYIPAQQIEVLTNPNDSDHWYDADLLLACPFFTPGWKYPCPGPKLFRLN